ncbi:MAG: T9SS type A sorting domain-containing protein [Firmicutes bacterium]|nr:T9SS type A sorting domain-containing protein [Bacillota bacterium]
MKKLNLKTKLITVITLSLMFVLTSCDGEEPNAINYGCVFIHTNAVGMILSEPPKKEIMESLIFVMNPNPAYDYVSIKFKTEGPEIVTITITDAKRKIVFNESFEIQNVGMLIHNYDIDIRNFPAGDYRVTVTIGKKKSCLILRKVA